MIKICMAGACGRMGRRILEMTVEAEDTAIGGAFDSPDNAGSELIVGGDSGQAQTLVIGGDAKTEIGNSDVLIDFTFADVCLANIRVCAELGVPAIIGTTGLSPEQTAEVAALSKKIPIVHAPNMSVGVNLLFKITQEVAATLGLDYNCEIVEMHHNQKKDAPSGTAVRLAECAAKGLGLDYHKDVVHGREGMVGARPRAEIGMHTMRGGDVVGDHTVSFVGQGERIELTHKAHNRDNFARGALVAARFAVKAEPGLYDMQDVLGLK